MSDSILGDYQNALTIEALEACERTGFDPLAMAEDYLAQSRRFPDGKPREFCFVSLREFNFGDPALHNYSIMIGWDDSALSVAIKILEVIQK